MNDLPCRVSADLRAHTSQQDEAPGGDVIDDWRKKREAELEAGNNVRDIMAALSIDDVTEYCHGLLAAALTPGDAGILRTRELLAQAIQDTLDVEEELMMKGLL